MFKKNVCFLFLIMVSIGFVFAYETISFTLEITGVIIDNGQLHVRVYSNDRDYRRDIPYLTIILESGSQTITHTFNIPEGDYLIAIFQDVNNVGRLETNLFGVPRVPVGLSNYIRGIPGGFNRHKFPINSNSSKITINMGRV